VCNWTPPLRNLEEGLTPDRNAVAELAKVCYFEVIHLVLRSLKIMKCRPGPVKKKRPLGVTICNGAPWGCKGDLSRCTNYNGPLGVASLTLVGQNPL